MQIFLRLIIRIMEYLQILIIHELPIRCNLIYRIRAQYKFTRIHARKIGPPVFDQFTSVPRIYKGNLIVIERTNRNDFQIPNFHRMNTDYRRFFAN